MGSLSHGSEPQTNLGWKRPVEIMYSNPLFKNVPLEQVVQVCIQSDFGISINRDSTTSQGNLSQGLTTHLMVKRVLLLLQTKESQLSQPLLT